jgi:hypothetical protein
VKPIDKFSASLKRTAEALEAGKRVDPLQCELCQKITDLLEAKTRWAKRTTDLGNSITTSSVEWQCKHCEAWNEA